MELKSQTKFFLYFLGSFIILFILLYSLGLVPETIKNDNGESFRTVWDEGEKKLIDDQKKQNHITIDTPIKKPAEVPTRIIIKKIGVDTIVSNPNTTDVKTLDDYLLRGAVHYPGSGLIGEGNMFIFGHSSSLSVVKNQAFKAFNGLRNLAAGDEIEIYAGTNKYIYKVNKVTLVDGKQALVDFGVTKNMLTLSTCNTFGAKTERYVVEADFVQ